jgi:hypothetical protein
VRRQELMPYWEIEPSGVRSARVTEVPGSRGLGFRLFRGLAGFCPKMIRLFIFPAPSPGPPNAVTREKGARSGLQGTVPW